MSCESKALSLKTSGMLHYCSWWDGGTWNQLWLGTSHLPWQVTLRLQGCAGCTAAAFLCWRTASPQRLWRRMKQDTCESLQPRTPVQKQKKHTAIRKWPVSPKSLLVFCNNLWLYWHEIKNITTGIKVTKIVWAAELRLWVLVLKKI